MASAMFVVPCTEGGPELPMELLTYTNEATGEMAGGWSCVGNVPVGGTCLVRVWSSDEQIDALAAMPDYLFVEDVVEEVPDGEG